jgi:hypothetical protein
LHHKRGAIAKADLLDSAANDFGAELVGDRSSNEHIKHRGRNPA